MSAGRIDRWITSAGIAVALFWAWPVSAQAFSSGSTGADGAFAPTANTTVTLPPSGVFNFTTVNIPPGVTVTFTPNSTNTPVTILASGDVTNAGTINLNGANGIPSGPTGLLINPGGAGGPGGFAGGNGGTQDGSIAPTVGQGPGGGSLGWPNVSGNGSFGASSSFTSLLPLFGGSGGAGSSLWNVGFGTIFKGASGGGGGGAMVIASSTKITVTGSIIANGGNGGNTANCFGFTGPPIAGGGSGGAIRLVALQVTGTGSLQAVGGFNGACGGTTQAENGRIRLEASTLSFTGSSQPSVSSTTSPGPVTTTSTPALMNVPTLTFRSVGGVSVPASTTGSFTAADVSLPQGTTNPVTVVLGASGVPVGTVFTVKMIPVSGDASSVSTAPSIGTFSNSTATANVTFPIGQVSMLNVSAGFTVPVQLAGLFPLIDGEPVERVMLAANFGEPTTVTLITRSGKELRTQQWLPLER